MAVEEKVLTVDGYDFEHWPPDVPKDETDYSLRAYITRIPDEKLAQYDPNWTDDENFKIDGTLMLVCCERDVEVDDFRQCLHEYLEFRKKAQEQQA